LNLSNFNKDNIKKQNSGHSSAANRPCVLFALQKTKLLTLERSEQTVCFVCLAKNKTPVISRSFNHQSKNEQLIRLFIAFYPKYVFRILLLEVCFNLRIAFSLICLTRSRVRSKVSPISSRVIGC
jgi:hypothetical protein